MINAQPTILYVEDDPFSREVMQVLLVRKMKFQRVTLFETSADFMSRLKSLPQKPDLIFLDIHLEPHNGFALLNMLRAAEDYRETKIVALTASVMNEEVEQLQDAGFDGVLAKPINQNSFPNQLERILGGERIWNVT